MYYIKCTTSSVLHQVYYIKCTASSVLHQVHYIKCNTSSVLHQVYYIKCTASSGTTSSVLHQVRCIKCTTSSVLQVYYIKCTYCTFKAVRRSWKYSLLERVWLGATTMESPVCTPRGSKFCRKIRTQARKNNNNYNTNRKYIFFKKGAKASRVSSTMCTHVFFSF